MEALRPSCDGLCSLPQVDKDEGTKSHCRAQQPGRRGPRPQTHGRTKQDAKARPQKTFLRAMPARLSDSVILSRASSGRSCRPLWLSQLGGSPWHPLGRGQGRAGTAPTAKQRPWHPAPRSTSRPRGAAPRRRIGAADPGPLGRHSSGRDRGGTGHTRPPPATHTRVRAWLPTRCVMRSAVAQEEDGGRRGGPGLPARGPDRDAPAG